MKRRYGEVRRWWHFSQTFNFSVPFFVKTSVLSHVNYSDIIYADPKLMKNKIDRKVKIEKGREVQI